MRLVLVDRLNDIKENLIVGQKYLSVNEEVSEYHFPHNPVLPAAIMFEASLQLGRVFFWKKTNFEKSIIPTEIKKFKFYKILAPGNILDISETITNNEISVVGTSNCENIFSGKFIYRLVDFDAIHDKDNCISYVNYLER